MRVAVLSSTYPCEPGDAVAPWAGDFTEALAEAGAEVVVLTGATEQPHRSTARVEVRAFPWRGVQGRVVSLLEPSPANALRIASYFRQGRRALSELCEEWRPDVLFALWAIPMGLLARSASRRLGATMGSGRRLVEWPARWLRPAFPTRSTSRSFFLA